MRPLNFNSISSRDAMPTNLQSLVSTSPTTADVEADTDPQQIERRREAAERTLIAAGWAYSHGASEWNFLFSPLPAGGRNIEKAMIKELKNENLVLQKKLHDAERLAKSHRQNLRGFGRSNLSQSRSVVALDQLRALVASAVVMEIESKKADKPGIVRCVLIPEAQLLKILPSKV